MARRNTPKPVPDYGKMYQLAEQYSEASRILEESAKDGKWTAPRLLVDSFAVELYLKCLYVLDTNKAPLEQHDWEQLFDVLKPFTKTAIRDEFERIVRNDPVLSHLDVINPEALRFIDFNRSLTAAKNTFDKGRYKYEAQLTSDWQYAHILREAIRTVTRMDIRLAGIIKDLEN